MLRLVSDTAALRGSVRMPPLTLLFLLCRPSLAHQPQKMLQGFFITLVLFFRHLMGAFIQLEGHFVRFVRRAA